MEIKNLSDKAAIAFSNRIVKSQDFASSCKQALVYSIPDMSRSFDKALEKGGTGIHCEGNEWVEDGLDCEVLEPGSMDWEKGKIKMIISFSFEYIPDSDSDNQFEIKEESSLESPLDEIRQMMN